MLFLSQCSAEEKPEKRAGVVDEVVDILTSTVAASFAKASLDQPAEAVDTIAEPEPTNLVSQISDLELTDARLYAAFDGGLIIYDFSKKTHEIIPVDERLQAVAVHQGKIYAGGENLYRLDDAVLEPLEDKFAGVITALYSYGHRLMIGTQSGLYSTSVFGRELLFDDVAVTAMAEDESGLWVGTRGQGLYRWDGETFKKRYLLRDSTLFDTVNTLDFRHRHLYMGTVNGLHIFNGGRWETFTTHEGLPSNNVSAVDASAWVIYIGTDMGVVSYFNADINPVDKLEAAQATDIRLRGRKIIVATDYEGILMKSGNVLKTLVQPVRDANLNILSLIEYDL
jgi:ligand-binding sensor domain-containing protein